MKKRRVVLGLTVVLLGLLCAQVSLAEQNQGEWLIGTWNGELRDRSGNAVGAVSMKITDVAPDGTLQGMWGVTGDKFYTAKSMKLDGAALKIVTAFDSVVEVTRESDDVLKGQFTRSNGTTAAATLTKRKKSTEFDGKWVGTATPKFPETCAPGSYELTVRDSEITATVVFTRERDHHIMESTAMGEVNPDRTARLNLTKKTADGRASQFTGVFEGSEFRAGDGNDKSVCFYNVLLKRR